MRNPNERKKEGIIMGIMIFFKMKIRKQQKQNKIIKIINFIHNIRFL